MPNKNGLPANPVPSSSRPDLPQASIPLPPTSLHSHASGSVVNSWALGAAAASNSQLQHQQLASLQQQHQQVQQQRMQHAAAGEGGMDDDAWDVACSCLLTSTMLPACSYLYCHAEDIAAVIEIKHLLVEHRLDGISWICTLTFHVG